MDKKRRNLVGRVVSDKMSKTVVVEVESTISHPLYRKTIRRVSRLKAHDTTESCRVGDVVRIEESRPISKTKHWRVLGVVSRSQLPEVQSDDSNLQ